MASRFQCVPMRWLDSLFAWTAFLTTLSSCSSEQISHRNSNKSGSESTRSATDTVASNERDADQTGEVSTIFGRPHSAVAEAEATGPFGDAAANSTLSEGVAVGNDVLGSFLQAPADSHFALTRWIVFEAPGLQTGTSEFKLKIPALALANLHDSDDDEEPVADQVGVIANYQDSDSGEFVLEAIGGGNKVKRSKDGTSYLIKVHVSGSFQVRQFRDATFPSKKEKTSLEPKKKPDPKQE